MERRPLASVLLLLLCIFSLLALVAPSFGIAVSKRGRKEKKTGSKATDTSSVWIFWYLIVFVPVFQKKKKKKEFSLEGKWRGFPKVSNKYPSVRPCFCWKKKIFGLVWIRVFLQQEESFSSKTSSSDWKRWSQRGRSIWKHP